MDDIEPDRLDLQDWLQATPAIIAIESHWIWRLLSGIRQGRTSSSIAAVFL